MNGLKENLFKSVKLIAIKVKMKEAQFHLLNKKL